MADTFDAVLVMGFGGPEKTEDVMPFLENVTRGRGVPRERLLEVAENYYLFGGRSPINDQCRALIAALQAEFERHGLRLPVYWGNRNWAPYLEATVRQMMTDGVQRAFAVPMSAYSGYSACRQYLDDLERAQAAIGPGAPHFERLPHFCLMPGFLEPMIENVRVAFEKIALEQRSAAQLLFTAHSIPVSMATNSKYLDQLSEVARLIAAGVGHPAHRLVFQSRSGPPQQPWLEPDVRDALAEAARDGVTQVVVAPIGFISDHMEVIFDLDTQARETAEKLGLHWVRAATVGTDPRFITLLRTLMEQRMRGEREAWSWPCYGECCPPPRRHSPAPGAPPAVRPGR